MFWFKKDAKFDELKIVIEEFVLGIVQIGSTHEVTQLDWIDKVASSYGAEGVIVSIQKRSLEVVNPDWKGINDLVREIGQRVFSASMEGADRRDENPVEPGQV